MPSRQIWDLERKKKGTENLRCQNKVENQSLQIKKIFILEKKKELSKWSKLNRIPERKLNKTEQKHSKETN